MGDRAGQPAKGPRGPRTLHPHQPLLPHSCRAADHHRSGRRHQRAVTGEDDHGHGPQGDRPRDRRQGRRRSDRHHRARPNGTATRCCDGPAAKNSSRYSCSLTAATATIQAPSPARRTEANQPGATRDSPEGASPSPVNVEESHRGGERGTNGRGRHTAWLRS